MDPTDASQKPAAPTSTAHPGPEPTTEPTGAARPGPEPTTEPTGAAQQPLGPDAASILAAESWSLLATRSLLWNDRISRTTIFLTVLSAAVVALALVADATGFGPTTRTVALVLLPVVLLIGLATFVRLVEIGNEDMRLVLAMNRVRHGYLTIAPGLEPYFSTGHHDDQQGLAASLLVAGPEASTRGSTS